MTARPEHALTFIVGGDMAASLPSWREPEAVLGLARLAVAERDGLRREDIARAAWSRCTRRPRRVLRHAPHRPLLVGHPRAGRRRAPGPVPRPRPVVEAIRSRRLYRHAAGGPAA